MKNKTKVFLLHNMIAPYRLPVFEEINKKFDLTVYFCYRKSKDRLWDTSLKGYRFKSYILPHIKLGPFILNYNLFFKLLLSHYDVYIVCKNAYETLFSVLVVLIIARAFKKPLFIWSEHIITEFSKKELESSLLKKIGNKVLKFYRKFLYKKTAAFIAYSRKAKEFLLKNGVLERKIFTGWQAIPFDYVSKVNILKSDTKYKNKQIILTMSYLKKMKGIEYLIQAFNDLKLELENAILIIIGVGEEEKKLKALAQGNKDIYFIGYKDGIEKLKWYAIADLFVLPTLHDAWGLVVNEAMCFGLPIITTTAAGCSEIIKDNGFVIPPGDKEKLKEAMKKILTNPELRRKMGQRSKEYNKIYTIEGATKPFINAINFVLSA